MKKTKKKFAGFILALVFLATFAVAFGETAPTSPAEAVAEITGRSLESLIAEKIESGKTYGSIAKEAARLDDFKDAMLKMKEKNLKDRGFTQEEIDTILEIIKKRQADCDGTNFAERGRGFGAKSGFGAGGAGQRFSDKNQRFGGGNRGGKRSQGQGGSPRHRQWSKQD